MSLKQSLWEKFIGDKAYIGDLTITTPYKKPRKKEISELQKKLERQSLLEKIRYSSKLANTKNIW